ncbi:MAG: peptidase M20, partial [Actinomycetota bacterium]
IDITSFSMQSPVRSPVDSLVGRAALRGAKEVFGKDPAPAPLMIATGPMYPIAGILGIPTVSPGGVCRPDSNIHAPNENVAVDDFLTTIEYTGAWIDAFATEA